MTVDETEVSRVLPAGVRTTRDTDIVSFTHDLQVDAPKRRLRTSDGPVNSPESRPSTNTLMTPGDSHLSTFHPRFGECSLWETREWEMQFSEETAPI